MGVRSIGGSAVLVLSLATACSSSSSGGGCPADAGPCGFGNSNAGGFGNTGNTGGFGNTGNTGAFGGSGGIPIGGSGGFGNTGNTGGVGNTGNTGGTGGVAANPNLGRACATSAECGVGLTCITASSAAFGGGGPAKGLCTADCTNDENLCAGIDAGAVCIDVGGPAYCFEGCSFGPDTLTNFDPNKCHGRAEVACTPLFDTAGTFLTAACTPQCNSANDCAGLNCNPETGMCDSTTPTGLALGQTCTPPASGAPDPCKGSCTGFVNDAGQQFLNMCTERCTLGAYPSCGWSSVGPALAACLFVSTVILDNGGAGVGDLGSCGQLCDCNSQCNPALVCTAWSGANAQATKDFFQRSGYCSVPDPPNVGITTCP